LLAYEECKKNDGISITRIVEYHEAIIKRIIALFLEENKIPRNFDLINKLFLIVKSEKGKINVSGNIFIEVVHHILQIATNEQELDHFSLPLEKGTISLPDGQLLQISILDKDEIKQIRKVYKKLLYVIIDYDKIDGNILLRNRKSGDKIRLANRSGTKSLKKLFIDEKLSNVAKSKQVVISTEDDEVLGVLGFGEDICVSPDENTTRFLVVLKRD
ncbi:MAG: tRNA lysidine(34) synthetase TilS, partial [Oscillospiraceae bacterium]